MGSEQERGVRTAFAPVAMAVYGQVEAAGRGSRRLSVDSNSSKTTAKISTTAAAISPSKKRRSQSMGGALTEAAARQLTAAALAGTDLSPRKRARRSLVPGRSILKPAAVSHQLQAYEGDATSNFTTTIYTQSISSSAVYKKDDPAPSSDEAENDSDDNAAAATATATTTTTTATSADTTRRLSRRVSFAPTAQMREFSKDANEDDDLADESLSNIGAPSSSPAAAAKTTQQQPAIYIPGLSNALDAHDVSAPPPPTASPSPAKATSGRRRSSSIRSSSGGGHRRRSSVANAKSLVESFAVAPQQPAVSSQTSTVSGEEHSLVDFPAPTADESGLLSNESAMDLADTSDVTTAFKSHFIFPTSSSQVSDAAERRTSVGHPLNEHNYAEASFGTSSADTTSQQMDLADDNVTSAFAFNTHLFGAPTPTPDKRTSSIFGQPSPARTAISPFRPGSSVPPSPATHRRRSHSPSKKVQQDRKEAEVKAAWEAEAIKRRSAIYGQPDVTSTTTLSFMQLQQIEHVHKEYHVPLGEEGIDEEEIVHLQRERAKRGSAAFFASRNSLPGEAGSSQVGFFTSSEVQTDTSIFAQHHGAEGEQGLPDSSNEVKSPYEDEDQTMDMSIVQDSRRVSNVFAVFADRRISTASETNAQIEEAEDVSPSPVKIGSLYPSIEELQDDTINLKSPTPGDRALAFLDEEDEEEDYNTTVNATDNHSVEQEQHIEQASALQAEVERASQQNPDEEESEHVQELELKQQENAQFNPFDFQRHRLSIVPERRDEEEEEEEEEEVTDDATQDMEETPVYGSNLQQSQPRRLSMAQPRQSLAPVQAAKSPARASKSPGKPRASPRKSIIPQADAQPTRRKSMSPEVVKSRIPIPSTTPARMSRHSIALPNAPPMAFTSLNEDGPARDGDSLFKTITSGSSIMNMTLPSPARALKSPSRKTGLTPDMRRMASSEDQRRSTLNMLASPAPPKKHDQEMPRESLAPMSEPFFDENAPSEGDLVERPKISLDQFMSIADMQFMDGLLSVSQAPLKRKNARPSLERGASNPLGSVSLADQISASAAVIPFLEGYRMMVSELRKSLRENSDVMDEMEEQIEEETPSLFLDYVSADDEDRAMLDSHFKITRAYYRLQTRSEWYMFRNGVSTSIGQMLHSHLEGLSADKAVIDETYQHLTSEHLPALRTRAQELAEELAKEKARQKELQECDQEHLNELRIAIKEQNSTIDDYKRDVAQTEGTLERLNAKEEELDSQAAECKDAIEASKRVCDEVKFYTKSELYRLEDELDLVQYLHGWRLVQYDGTRVELSHRNEISITILFGPQGHVEDFELVLLQQPSPSRPDHLHANRMTLNNFLFDRLLAHIGQPQSHYQLKAKDLLRKISNLWTRARYIRAEFALLAQRYPLQMSMFTKKSKAGQPFLRASARVYAEAARAEFAITFELTGDEITGLSSSTGSDLEDCLQDIGTSVDIKYGNVDREELSLIVRERVANSGTGALLEACQEAEAHYA